MDHCLLSNYNMDHCLLSNYQQKQQSMRYCRMGCDGFFNEDLNGNLTIEHKPHCCIQMGCRHLLGDISHMHNAPHLNCLDEAFQVYDARPIPQDDLSEGYVRLQGAEVRYVIHGHGPMVLFFTYGVLGEIQNSFKKQVGAFDPNVFTSIFWDPPGYGKSLPRERHFVPYKYMEDDVVTAYELLQHLNVTKVSLFGWCDGGHLSFLFSLKYPHMVHKLVIWGTKDSLTKDNVRVFSRMRQLSNWSPVARSEVLKAYDHDATYIITIFNRYVDTIHVYFQSYGGNVYQELLPYVTAPALVFHSADDVMVSSQQVRNLTSQLRESSFHMFSSGGHSCHIKHWQVFNEISKDFILAGVQ